MCSGIKFSSVTVDPYTEEGLGTPYTVTIFPCRDSDRVYLSRFCPGQKSIKDAPKDLGTATFLVRHGADGPLIPSTRFPVRDINEFKRIIIHGRKLAIKE